MTCSKSETSRCLRERFAGIPGGGRCFFLLSVSASYAFIPSDVYKLYPEGTNRVHGYVALERGPLQICFGRVCLPRTELYKPKELTLTALRAQEPAHHFLRNLFVAPATLSRHLQPNWNGLLWIATNSYHISFHLFFTEEACATSCLHGINITESSS